MWLLQRIKQVQLCANLHQMTVIILSLLIDKLHIVIKIARRCLPESRDWAEGGGDEAIGDRCLETKKRSQINWASLF